MIRLALSLLAASTLAGCIVLHADLPPEMVDDVNVQIHDAQVGAVCLHAGKSYSTGSTRCMDGNRMRCEADSHWGDAGEC